MRGRERVDELKGGKEGREEIKKSEGKRREEKEREERERESGGK